jgi:peptide/nickel transport system substrate-binding protein
MQRVIRSMGFILVTAMMLTLLVGVVATQDEVVLVVGIEQEPEQINPLSTMSFAAYIESFHARDLWEWDNARTAIPVMAAAIPSVEDGTAGLTDEGNTWVEVTIREGLFWSDGVPITAASCEPYHNILMNRDLSANIGRGVYPDVIESFEIVDDLTFRLTYNSFFPDFVGATSSGAIATCFYPGHILQAMLDEYGTIDDSPYWDATDSPVVSFGPYNLVARERTQSWTLVKNEYWPEEFVQPQIDRIILQLIEDDSQMRNAMRVGDIDLSFNWSDDQVDDYVGMEGVEVWPNPGVYSDALWIRMGETVDDHTPARDALTDLRVRQAIVHALDRQFMADNLIGPGIEVPKNWYPPTLWPDDLVFLEYNVDKARELLDEAGWMDHDGDEGTAEAPTPRQNADGAEMVGLRLTTTENELRNNYQLLIQEFLAQVGISIEIPAIPATTHFANFTQDGTLTGYHFDLAIFANSADPLTPLGGPDSYQCSGIPTAENPDGFNPWQFCVERYDEVDNLIGQTAPGPERDALAEEAVTLFQEAAFWNGLRLRATWFALRGDKWDFGSFQNLGTLSGNYFNNAEAWRLAE